MSHHPRPPFLRCAAGLLLAGLASGCGGVAIDAFGRNDAAANDTSAANDGGGVSVDGGGVPVDSGGTPADGGSTIDRPTTPIDAGAPFCPAATCVAGMRCCEALRRCIPGGVLCPDDAPDGGVILDAGPGACVTARDCSEGSECVFPDSVCARSGTCEGRIACLRPETFCSCTGVTYSGCRPDRPTSARGPCGTPVDAGTDAGEGFCLRALCPAGSVCCEAERTCAPAGTRCGAPVDAGVVDAGPPACATNADCGPRAWCAGDGCGTRGVCTPLGDTCPAIYSPVCGCDGRTYSNDCIANYFTGVRVASRGACPGADAGVADSGPIDSGPIDSGVIACRTNADCPSDRYCAGDGCGVAGTCAGRPLGCTAEYNPVCGCDGRTYGNACGAASAGVRVASRGACAVDAGVVDSGVAACLTDTDCRAGNQCVYPSTACARSGVCTSTILCFVTQPFCSCTGETYRACRPDRPTAATGECASTPDAGTSFCATARCTATTFCCESARACIPLGSTCPASGACASNADCGARQWCSGSGCGTAGTCAPLADACPTLYSPVCGCDRRTYSNECLAGAAGVRVASRGACP